MADSPDNLIIEHLKAIRFDLGDIRRELRDVKTRLASLENQVVQMRYFLNDLQAAAMN